MTPIEAEDYARVVYLLPEAAPLLVAAFDADRSREDRSRCLLALDVLLSGAPDPRLEFPPPRVPEVMAGCAVAIAELVTTLVYSAERAERVRVAGLLSQVCREAARIVHRKRAA